MDVGLAHTTRLLYGINVLSSDPRGKKYLFKVILSAEEKNPIHNLNKRDNVSFIKVDSKDLFNDIISLVNTFNIKLITKFFVSDSSVAYIKRLHEILLEERPDVIMCDTNVHFMFAVRMYLDDIKGGKTPVVISMINGYILLDKVDLKKLPPQIPQVKLIGYFNSYLSKYKNFYLITELVLRTLNSMSMPIFELLKAKVGYIRLHTYSFTDLLRTEDIPSGYHFILDFPNVTLPMKNNLDKKRDKIIGPFLIELQQHKRYNFKNKIFQKPYIFITMGGTTSEEVFIDAIKFALLHFKENVIVTTGNIITPAALRRHISDQRLHIFDYLPISKVAKGSSFVISHGGAGTHVSLINCFTKYHSFPKLILVPSNIDQLERAASLAEKQLALLVYPHELKSKTIEIDAELMEKIHNFSPQLDNVQGIPLKKADSNLKKHFFKVTQ